jgi:uncharacterized integral membrane protein
LRYLKAAFFFVLAVAGILFGISNQDNATVHFFWYFSKSYPLYLVLFACFLAGTVIAILYGFISGGDMKDKERRSNKHVEDLKGRLKKAQAGKTPFTPPGSIDGSPGSTP